MAALVIQLFSSKGCGVDLVFLQLSRFEPAERSEDSTEEDRHCDRMRQLGAWSFSSVDSYHMIGWMKPELLDGKPLVVAAWPQSGEGVWVLTARDRDEAAEKGLGRVWNASTMDERCEVVESLGGIFYSDPTLCPAWKLVEDMETYYPYRHG
ncbi:Uu.00g144820.m01.CDS01 [Anthostomella pinea]|uniref:Uu.00g144820.m01.CDS01 n=1 Tax=Anthostomella pinea TaxID=933095 RepID=A0AAI8VR10_9PEZI|nr:Uu.00g144820.m01.CDS01 [Anthostomella pinea]